MTKPLPPELKPIEPRRTAIDDVPDFAFNGPTLEWWCRHGVEMEKRGSTFKQTINTGKAMQLQQEHDGYTLADAIRDTDKKVKP
jgi:hypothetical protein